LNKQNPHGKGFQRLQSAGLQKRKSAHSIAVISLLAFIIFAAAPAQAGPLEQKLMDAAFMGKVETARNLSGSIFLLLKI